MKQFLSRHEDRITGVLSGFDRLVFRGTLRHISYTDGMGKYLSYQKILLKEFAEFALQRTSELKQALYQQAERLERPVVYLESSRKNKEAIAREIAQQDNVRSGLIAVLSCVEPCITFSIRRNRQKKRLELVQSLRKCLNFYHYCMDPIFGFMHAHIQSWFPFNVQVYVNGREWLAVEMDKAPRTPMSATSTLSPLVIPQPHSVDSSLASAKKLNGMAPPSELFALGTLWTPDSSPLFPVESFICEAFATGNSVPCSFPRLRTTLSKPGG